MFTYQTLIAFTLPNGAAMAVGNTFTDEGSLGQKLCRSGFAKDVTPHVTTNAEIIADHETRIVALESEQHSPSASAS